MRCMSEAVNLDACWLGYMTNSFLCVFISRVSIVIKLSRNFVKSPVIGLSLYTL